MKKLDYQHISLVPRVVSDVISRSCVNTSTKISTITLDVPIISAPMPDVCNGQMAVQLAKLGCMGLIHRFQSIEEQKIEFLLSEKNDLSSIEKSRIGCAVGLKEFNRIEELFNVGCRLFCVDTANGANKQIEKTIEYISNLGNIDSYGRTGIIVGNVASIEGYHYLNDLGVSAVRVGIAGGSVCETKTETGIYYPMASLIEEIVNGREKIQRCYRPAEIIADGGIKIPADMCKALALGADAVMVGGILAGCAESPSSMLKVDGVLKKVLRGAASFSVQQENSGNKPTYIEGRETLVNYSGHVENVIKRFKGGLQSSMSYMNAKYLPDFRKNVRVIEI